MIPYGKQSISDEDIRAVEDILRSDWLTQGPAVDRFEQKAADYCGARHAVAVNSATSALHLACRALGLGPGDRLWTSPNTFVASANCALYCGAEVDFVDIDARTYNMSAAGLEEKLLQAEREGGLPKIVVAVHFAGQSCDMRRMRELGERFGFAIIEDASHAVGGRYLGRPVGGCQYSDIAVFSFHPVKIITTGEGGMALTNRTELHERMLLLRSHGITRNPAAMTRQPDGDWYYQQIDLGYNFRLTDIQAALGLSQLARLDKLLAQRRRLVQRYNQALEGVPLTLPWQHPDAESAWHLYVVRINGGTNSKARDLVFAKLRAAGIGVNVHYIPVHTQPYFQRLGGFGVGDFPESERYYQEALTLPLFPGLSDEQQDFVMAALDRALL